MSAGIVFIAVLWFLIVWLIVGAWRLGRRRIRPGTAFLSSMEGLFDDNRRAAAELIIEERTGYRDPEDREGQWR